MSGHSKWSTIKRQKGAADAKKANVFTKLANGITVAARHGSDPTMNFQLRLVMDRAGSANMPKENIERAVARAASVADANAVSELVYEIYGPSGVAVLAEVATDNKNRAAADIKAVLNKFGGKLAGEGAVKFLFERKGTLSISTGDKTQEDAELAIIGSGASDYEKVDGVLLAYTKPEELELVKKNLETHNISIDDAKLAWEPKQTVALDEEASAKVIKVLEALDSLDDVVSVASNLG
ncbi:MAG TPA: YebC/PmpR family DNA-binding transcriptional regulator [Patescibacteria group bacterium]|nr:YebC/PmpR family DNA-binding transcriptional regulator [Patescibacteria group bacterium]